VWKVDLSILRENPNMKKPLEFKFVKTLGKKVIGGKIINFKEKFLIQ